VDVLNSVQALDGDFTVDEDTPTTLQIIGNPLFCTEYATIAKIVSLPESGTLWESGTQIILTDTITEWQLADGTVEYVPPENVNGYSVATFDFLVTDDTGFSSLVRTVDIHVTALPDAVTFVGPEGTFDLEQSNTEVVASVAIELSHIDDPDPTDFYTLVMTFGELRPKFLFALSDANYVETCIDDVSDSIKPITGTYFDCVLKVCTWTCEWSSIQLFLSEIEIVASQRGPVPAADNITLTVYPQEETNEDFWGDFVIYVWVDTFGYQDLISGEAVVITWETIAMWGAILAVPMCLCWCCCAQRVRKNRRIAKAESLLKESMTANFSLGEGGGGNQIGDGLDDRL